MDREQGRRLHRGAITGLLVGLSLTLLGGWLLILGIVVGDILPFVVGFFVLVFGVVSVESGVGLFEGAPYHGQAWTGWIAMRADREEKERRKKSKATRVSKSSSSN